MPDSKARTDFGWEELVRECDWDGVENWYIACFDDRHEHHDALATLLARLEEIVPKVKVTNRMEKAQRYALPTDPNEVWVGKEHFKGAAVILQLGELAAAVYGDPKSVVEEWSDYRDVIITRLENYLEQEEPTTGDAEYSRGHHCLAALEGLGDVQSLMDKADTAFDTDDDLLWLREIMSEIAYLSFDAGRRTQAAWGKDIENLAFMGSKVHEGQKRGGDGRRQSLKQKKSMVLKEMKRLKEVGHSIENAARICAEKGIGTSLSANKAMWFRNKRTKKE